MIKVGVTGSNGFIGWHLCQTLKLQIDRFEIIEFNRNTLNSVDKWINKDDWNIPKSIFNYGLPPCIFHLIDLPLNQDITEVDMICNYML